MDRSTFDKLIAEGSDGELLEAVWENLPEDEDEWGKYDGDPLRVTQYADAEISNGGFFQFYANGIFDPRRLIEHLRTLGAEDLAACVEDSMAAFPEGVPPLRTPDDLEPIDDRLAELGITTESFSEIEDRYYAAHDELHGLWADYVRENADEYFEYVE